MKRAVVFVLAVLLSSLAFAQQQVVRTGHIADRGLKTTDFPRHKKLADNVYAWEDLHISGNGYTTNSLIVVTNDGVVVADGQGNVEATKKMVDFIGTLTPKPIKYVVVCSEHGDHTGGNAAFPSTVTFLAHPNSQPNVKMPTEPVATKKAIKLGGTDIEVMFLGRAHTGGDLLVYLPKEKILFTSEVFFNHIFPSTRTAYPSEWIGVLKKVEKTDARIVMPGHGFVDDPQVLKEELTNYRKAMEATVAEVARMHKTGASVQDGLKQANWGPYDSWTARDRNAPILFQRVYDELNGKLK